MEAIHFEVGAKAARLIGRENITDPDGALMELIKNAYDADASCVCVWFDMPFPFVPSKLGPEKIRSVLTEEDQKRILDFYTAAENGEYVTKAGLLEEETSALWSLLTKYNSIVVADNGCGMSTEDVRTKWMYIGTSDKEIHIESQKGRIKTGAKGIGRFALDKLSLRSMMLTRSPEHKLAEWKIDWEQFENSKLLVQVKASLAEREADYADEVKELVENRFAKAFSSDRNWETGTAIRLYPVREEWTYRMFEKINTNLKSINPLGAADPFKVYVKNRYYPEYDFETDDTAIDVSDYDYKIEVRFDGERTVTTVLTRNEVDIHRRNVNFPEYDKKVSLKSFWERPYFQREGYRRQNYEGVIEFPEDAAKILRDDPAKIKNVGPFCAELYFVKNRNGRNEIIKNVKVRKRSELLRKFSGVKLYRDEFKVRPYGDDGNDWLELAKRQTESPGGVGSESGSWRVLPYQLIGQVKIGRRENPALYDMANREGLTQNDEYHILVELLQNSIRVFELDRQGFYKEYAKWSKKIKNGFGKDANIRADVQSKYGNAESRREDTEDQQDREEKEERTSGEGRKYTDAEYEETIFHLMKEKKEMLNSAQLLQLLSSNGLMLNTFFHEFRAIQSQFGSRAVQLRYRLDYMEKHNTFHPGFIYDPFIIIDKMEETDGVLNLWLQVSMDGTKKENLGLETVSLNEELNSILANWSGLLRSKDIVYKLDFDEEKEYHYEISQADLYIIMNNFLLNSAYFLEKGHNPQRRITVTLVLEKENYHLRLWNNGPALEEEYRAVPDRIFELGVSSKEDGTGIGLWIMRETVERYNGTIMVAELESGFGLDIYLRK